MMEDRNRAAPSTGESRRTTEPGRVGLGHLSDTERYRLLSSERRRSVLSALVERTLPVGLRELSLAVHARESGAGVGDLEFDESVLLALHHHHLPKMDAVEVLDYDAEKRLVDVPGA
jgi:hypothetical protein